MAKAWVLKNEKDLDNESSYKKFEIKDKHIEVTHTPRFMGFVWMIGGLICVGLMRSTGDYTGLIGGLIGIGIIWLISQALSTKLSKDIHLIFYAERDKKHEDYFGIDLKTNEILYVQHIYADPNDEHPATVYAFEPVTLENFKNYLANCSERYYKLVKDITPATRNTLRNIQFGETVWNWVWFVKKAENEKVKLGCIRIGYTGDTFARYVEIEDADYSKYFGKFTELRDAYKAFMEPEAPIFKKDSIKSLSKRLSQEEIQTLISIFNGDSRKCEVNIEKYFNKEFVAEYEYKGNASVSDFNGLKFLQHLFNEENTPFSPTVFSDEQVLKEPVIEKRVSTESEDNDENKSESQNTYVNQANDKYKNYGLISLICSIAAFVTIIPLSWVAGLIFGILSIKHTKEQCVPNDKKAVAGVIISSLEGLFLIFGTIGLIIG